MSQASQPAVCTPSGSQLHCTDGTFEGSANIVRMQGNGSLIMLGNASVNRLLIDTGNAIATSDFMASYVAVSAGTNITFDQDTDGTFSGTVMSGGKLVKDGSGALTLSGNNSYSGGTDILNGRLIGSTFSLKNDFAISGGAELEFHQNDDGTHAGQITGDGTLIKSGIGRLLLTGNNSYSGGTAVHEGILAGDTNALRGAIAVNSGAAVEFHQNDDGTHAGQITGDGTLIKSGIGRLLLTGNNSYSGGTQIQQGILVGDTNALQGAIAINSGAAVEFHQNDGGTHTGQITGDGTLIKSGTGRLLLTGNNSYSGSTQVEQGTLAGDSTSLQGVIDVASGANVEFAQTQDGTFNGSLMGNGSLLKTGDGLLTLAGNVSLLGNVSIMGGELLTAGPMMAPLNAQIAAGARLSGQGQFGQLMIAGTFAPRDFGGVTAHSLAFMPGGFYEIRVDETGARDHVTVAGAAILNNATLRVLPLPGQYANGSVTTTILSANQVVGTFGNTSIDSATFRGSLAYSGHDVTLTLEQIRALREAVTRHSNRGPAAALDDMSETATGEMAALLQELYALDQKDLDQAMHVLSGADSSSTAAMSSASTAALTGGIAQRMADLRFGSAGGGSGNSLLTQLAFSGGNSAAALDRLMALGQDGEDIQQQSFLGLGSGPSQGARPGLWVRGVAGWGSRDADSQFSRQTYDMQGLIVGTDTQWNENLTLGVAFGLANGDSKTSDGSLKGSNTTVFASGYGGWSQGDWRIDGSLGLARHDLESTRHIQAGGLALTAKGDHLGYEVIGDIGTSYRIALDHFTLEPLAGLSLSHLWEEGWTERGAGAANLRMDSTTRFSATSRLGAGLWRSFDIGSGYTFIPHAEAMWLRALADRDVDLVAGFAQAGSSTWQVAGRRDPLDTAMFGLSATLEGRDMSFSAGWAGRFGEDSTDHAIRLRAGLTW
ncbi:autotransporter outer membrane beta-barrel domain-containing protein [Telmatospirillum sp. J64-1]|uniref:autotransporter outer membrane beta-barrel domain-containing protein n=1 Tax=Telmatospirillum sp. J64-1 TaxID=2502183 RepID=UPI00163D4FEF|nr:autotransporter outer membrane beta-barrel domain-containing protein [Telmatospirillum sp. J64-1]